MGGHWVLMKAQGCHEAVPKKAWDISSCLRAGCVPEKTRAPALGLGWSTSYPALCTLCLVWGAESLEDLE